MRFATWMMLLLVAGCGEITRIEDAGGDRDDAQVVDDALPPDGPVPDSLLPDGPVPDAALPDASIDAAVDAAIDAAVDAPPPRCGDGIVNGAEVCDDGAANGSYGACNATCSGPGPRCGDGAVNGPEVCDSGLANGNYGACNATCSGLGPRCGDGTVNGPESCDSGRNNGSYGYCDATCSGPGPRCGDRIVNGPERCDTATVYSPTMPAGACRPDCAGPVVERLIAVTDGRLSPAQGGVAGLDARCQTERGTAFRALVVDGTTRVASTTPYSGAGQVGWVLQPYTRYVSAETQQLVFITDATRLLGAAGGVGVDLYNPIRAADDGWGAWTGARADWTSGADCADWSSSASTDTGLSCNTTATSPAGFPNNGGVSNCAQLRRFFCVQQ